MRPENKACQICRIAKILTKLKYIVQRRSQRSVEYIFTEESDRSEVEIGTPT